MKDFLEALTQRVEKNTASLDNFRRMHVPSGIPLKQKEGEPIKVLTLFKHIQVVIVTSADMLGKLIDGYTYDISGPISLFSEYFYGASLSLFRLTG
jgi:pyruvate decarboxylase